MAFFNGWPWTQFQEQNLDWLIRNQKKLESEIQELKEDIMYPVTPDVTELKNDVEMLNRNMSPIYLGDYYTGSGNTQGSVVFNGIYHAIGFNGQDNNGTLYRFDLASNTKLADMTIEMGHGNSMCYSPATDYVYIVPRFKYTGGVETDEYMLYRYTSDFQNILKIPTTFLPRAITRDPITGIIYVYGVDSNIYVYNETTMTTELFCVFNFATTYVGIDGRNYQLNQDIAAYDGKFYLSGTRGLVYVGNLTPGVSDAKYGFMMDNHDIDEKYWMIENEGWEFTDDGHLLCTYTTDVGGPTTKHAWMAFLTEINVGTTEPYAASGPINTLQLASFAYNSTYAGQLSHYYQDLCDPHMIHCLVYHPDTVFISSAYTSDIGITFWDDINLVLEANVEILSLNIWKGRLSLSNNAGVTLTLTRSSQPIQCGRAGSVSFSGSNPLNVSLPNITGTNRTLVQPDTNSAAMTIVAQVPTSAENINLRIGAPTDIQKGIFIGTDLAVAIP